MRVLAPGQEGYGIRVSAAYRMIMQEIRSMAIVVSGRPGYPDYGNSQSLREIYEDISAGE